MTVNTLLKFSKIFAGREDAYGTIAGSCVKEKVTISHFYKHLSGKLSLGIYPLRQDRKCRWAAIDIDKDAIDIAIVVIEALYKIGLNSGIYLERSKSKGYHILLFFSDWVLARNIRQVMAFAVLQAGLPPTTELFPKQDSLDGIKFGNYLDLPYFGGGIPAGRRMVLDLKTLQPIMLEQWLSGIKLFPLDELQTVLANIPESIPIRKRASLSHFDLFKRPLQVGERRPTLVRLAGYLLHRGVAEDLAVALLVPWAKEMFIEQLDPSEIEKHVRGIYRRYGIERLAQKNTLTQIPEAKRGLIEEIWG